MQVGDTTIIVDSNCGLMKWERKHLLAVRVFELIATGKRTLIASNNKKSGGRTLDGSVTGAILQPGECYVGIYKPGCKGTYYITVKADKDCKEILTD